MNSVQRSTTDQCTARLIQSNLHCRSPCKTTNSPTIFIDTYLRAKSYLTPGNRKESRHCTNTLYVGMFDLSLVWGSVAMQSDQYMYRMAAHMESRTVQGGRTLGVTLYRVAAHWELYCTVDDEPSRGSIDEVESQLLVLTRQGAVLVLQGSVLLQVNPAPFITRFQFVLSTVTLTVRVNKP